MELARFVPAKGRRWYTSERLEAVVLLLGALAATGFGLHVAFQKDTPEAYGWIKYAVAAVVAFAVCVIKVLRSTSSLKGQDADEQKWDLTASLHVLHAAILAHQRTPASCTRQSLRVVIHGFEANAHADERVVQLVDYVGGTGMHTSQAGTRYPERWGLVGRAVATNRIAGYERDGSLESYTNDMQEMCMSSADVASRNPHAKSMLAIPVGNPIFAVLYSDSTNQGFFDDVMVNFMVAACEGWIRYARLR